MRHCPAGEEEVLLGGTKLLLGGGEGGEGGEGERGRGALTSEGASLVMSRVKPVNSSVKTETAR
jgi:hypothetical protein